MSFWYLKEIEYLLIWLTINGIELSNAIDHKACCTDNIIVFLQLGDIAVCTNFVAEIEIYSILYRICKV